jgi:gamma-glutamyltranspeptidase/glutathione hydrolase
MLEMAEKNMRDISIPRPCLYAGIMRRAYQDRSQYLGDSRFIPDPTPRLTRDSHLRASYTDVLNFLSQLRSPNREAPQSEEKKKHTSHFNIIDRDGMAVASTQTINSSFGSKLMFEGIVLNNEMDDFTTSPGKPNTYGLIQSENNSIKPGKTPLSSMSPTLVERDGKLVLAVGTPGGSQIISTVIQLISGLLIEGADPKTTMTRARIHHQFLPDLVRVEPDSFVVKQLQSCGFEVKIEEAWTVASLIVLVGSEWIGVTDSRGFGRAMGL